MLAYKALVMDLWFPIKDFVVISILAIRHEFAQFLEMPSNEAQLNMRIFGSLVLNIWFFPSACFFLNMKGPEKKIESFELNLNST